MTALNISVLLPFLTLSALYAILISVLGIRVTLARIRFGNIPIGDGGHDLLLRRIRAHGNFAEYAPLQLATVLAAGLAGLPLWSVWALAGACVTARLLHAWSMPTEARMPARIAGMMLQHSSLCLGGLAILWVALA